MDMLRKSIDESNKVMEGIASALTEIGKGIGAGLAALANSFNPSPQTYPQYSQSHSSQKVVPAAVYVSECTTGLFSRKLIFFRELLVFSLAIRIYTLFFIRN